MVEAKVFISHSTAAEDADLLATIRHVLRQEQISPVVVIRDYYAGSVSEKIQTALRGSDYVLVVLTKAAALAPWVNQEIGIAVGAQKPTIVLLEEGVKPPGTVAERDQIRFTRPGVLSALRRAVEFILKDVSEKAPLLVIRGTLDEPPRYPHVVLRVLEFRHVHSGGGAHTLDRAQARAVMDQRAACVVTGGYFLLRTVYDDRGELKELRFAAVDLPFDVIREDDGLYNLPRMLKVSSAVDGKQADAPDKPL